MLQQEDSSDFYCQSPRLKAQLVTYTVPELRARIVCGGAQGSCAISSAQGSCAIPKQSFFSYAKAIQ